MAYRKRRSGKRSRSKSLKYYTVARGGTRL